MHDMIKKEEKEKEETGGDWADCKLWYHLVLLTLSGGG